MPTTLDFLIIATQREDGLHQTLLSLIDATKSIKEQVSLRVIMDDTQSTPELLDYLKNNDAFVKSADVGIVNQTLSTLDLSESAAKFTAFINAGDCLTERTLLRLLSAAEANSQSVVYPHSDVRYLNVLKPNEVHENVAFPQDMTAALLGAWQDQRFSRFIIIPTQALHHYSAPVITAGYGHANWHLITSLIDQGYLPTRVDETAVFTLDRSTHTNHNELLTPSSLFSLIKLRDLIPGDALESTEPLSKKEQIKNLLSDYPLLTKAAQKSLHYMSIVKQSLPSKVVSAGLDEHHDAWLIEEANTLHAHNASIFLSTQKKFHIYKHADSLTESFKVGTVLAQSSQHLRHDTYDYVLFVPWLIAGGADMFFVNYANSIAELRPDKKVLVISTEPSKKSLSNQALGISNKVDFLRLAEIVGDHKDSDTIISQSLALLIDITRASALHIGLSRLGYKYIAKHHDAIKSTGRKVILTGYNEIVTDDGKREGYVHDVIPSIFKYADVIVTDNNKVAHLWQADYGLSPEKVTIHHQPFTVPEVNRKNNEVFSETNPVRVLWAAHIRKEKNPITFAEVAKRLSNNPLFSFTAYGALDKVHYRRNPFTHPGSTNLQYGGSYRNFFEEVNPNKYDVFVYTSLADGTPNILIEAGLGELPIITSEVGGIGALIKNNGVLINNPTSTDDFVRSLKEFAKDPSIGYKKAAAFKKHLLKTQTHTSFNNEVSAMLERINY